MTEIVKIYDVDDDFEYIRIDDNEDKIPNRVCSVFVGWDYDGGKIWLTYEQAKELRDGLDKFLKEVGE